MRGISRWALLFVDAALVLALFSQTARAQEGGLVLQIDALNMRSHDTTTTSGLRDVLTAGLSIDANVRMGKGHVAHAAFIDLHFGAGLDGGFAYNMALLPLGLALYDRKQYATLSVATGVRYRGVTGHKPAALLAPLRASLVVRAGTHVLLNGWASAAFTSSDARQSGSNLAPFGDELSLGVTVRLGPGGTMRPGRGAVSYGNGYFAGVLYEEHLGGEFWGITIGHGVNMRGY